MLKNRLINLHTVPDRTNYTRDRDGTMTEQGQDKDGTRTEQGRGWDGTEPERA